LRKLNYIFLFIVFGCAQVTSLNLKKHQFGKIPTQIVWIQVAGLAPEHLVLLKYSYPSIKFKTAFEDSLCLGNMWEYNLYDLRPDAKAGFLAQMTGKKNIKNDCSDYTLKPIWSYLNNQGYKVGVFEGESSEKESLLHSRTCKQGQKFLEGTTLWRMSKPTGKNTFHANENKKYRENTIYYDKSCASKECFSTLSRNIEETFKSFSRSSKNFLYIVRNFQYAKYLKQKNIPKAKSELSEINSVLDNFQKMADKNSDMLVLLTSAKAVGIDFPRSGREWKQYEKRGKYLFSRKSKLISTVYASGARAENFCGIYDQSQILTRIFSGAKQQGLEFSSINPFE
jgi:hypothetical protein